MPSRRAASSHSARRRPYSPPVSSCAARVSISSRRDPPRAGSKGIWELARERQSTSSARPGRANLMGEHTDYNDGYVLPFALGQGVAVAAARRAGGRLVLCSRQQPDRAAERSWTGPRFLQAAPSAGA